MRSCTVHAWRYFYGDKLCWHSQLAYICMLAFLMWCYSLVSAAMIQLLLNILHKIWLVNSSCGSFDHYSYLNYEQSNQNDVLLITLMLGKKQSKSNLPDLGFSFNKIKWSSNQRNYIFFLAKPKTSNSGFTNSPSKLKLVNFS